MSEATPPLDDRTTPAVIYAAKSTEDRHGSIPTQIEDCRAMAQEEGWTVVGEYHDEGFSAYRGNRGPGLARAREHAAEVAAQNGTVAVLVVQHSDRISRGAGDRPGAAEALVEIWHAERRRNVHLKSVQDDFALRDSASVANTGERNRSDSERKGSSTRDGLRRRKERGDPVGPIPDGYHVGAKLGRDGLPELDDRGLPVTARVINEDRAPVVRRQFDLAAAGQPPGSIARTLNVEGIRTQRGTVIVARRVRETLQCRAYLGENGYPRLIDQDTFEAAQATLAQRRIRKRGGPQPQEAYLLLGVATCGECGAPMYSRRLAAGRSYICRNKRLSTGLCTAPAVRADVLEGAVLLQLEDFIGKLDDWVAERLAARHTERDALEAAAERERERFRELDRRVLAAEKHYEQTVADEPTLAAVALRQVARMEQERDGALAAVEKAEARVAEWTAPPDVDAAARWLDDVLRAVAGQVARAEGSDDLALALRTALRDVAVEVDGDALEVRISVNAEQRELRNLQYSVSTVCGSATAPLVGTVAAALSGPSNRDEDGDDDPAELGDRRSCASSR